MVQAETRLLERYIGGLQKSIKGSVTTSKSKDLHETMETANKLMDQVLEDVSEMSIDNKRKWDDVSKGSHNNSQYKKQNVVKAYAVGSGEKKGYVGNTPPCNRCTSCHKGECTVKCHNCQKVGHLAKNCRSRPLATAQAVPSNNCKAEVTCYGCGEKGHYRNEFKKPINQGNSGGYGNQEAAGNNGN